MGKKRISDNIISLLFVSSLTVGMVSFAQFYDYHHQNPGFIFLGVAILLMAAFILSIKNNKVYKRKNWSGKMIKY